MTTGSNWAHRYGANTRRLCARPGCGAPAAATLRFQPTQREAWLVDLDDGARTEGDLCARHAAGLVLPRGWQLHNGLTAVRAGSSTTLSPVPRRRTPVTRIARRRRPRPDAIELPGLEAVPEPEAAPARPPVLRIAPAPLVAPPTQAESEALAETLDAQTPLLRRAFSNVRMPGDDS